MPEIDAEKCGKGTPGAESGTLPCAPRGPTIQQDILRIGTIRGKKTALKGNIHPRKGIQAKP